MSETTTRSIGAGRPSLYRIDTFGNIHLPVVKRTQIDPASETVKHRHKRDTSSDQNALARSAFMTRSGINRQAGVSGPPGPATWSGSDRNLSASFGCRPNEVQPGAKPRDSSFGAVATKTTPLPRREFGVAGPRTLPPEGPRNCGHARFPASTQVPSLHLTRNNLSSRPAGTPAGLLRLRSSRVVLVRP